jgi:hypothetical protein
MGIEGGKQAANALRNAVLEHCSELTDEIEIMAKVCANITGLSKAMRRDGSLETPDDLRDFTLGFTQGKASFDFIDVGHGKERADSKIKGTCHFKAGRSKLIFQNACDGTFETITANRFF